MHEDERGGAESPADLGPPGRVLEEIRTPRAAAVAGIAFALLLGAVVILMYLALPGTGSRSTWITDAERRGRVALAMQAHPLRRHRLPLVHRGDPIPSRAP